MESVKTKLHSSITAAIGQCTVQYESREQCMKICMHAHPKIVIFVQPDR